MSEEVTSITGIKTMTALNPAGARAMNIKKEQQKQKKSIISQLRKNIERQEVDVQKQASFRELEK